MHQALATLHVVETKQAQLFAARDVIEQGRKNRAITYTFSVFGAQQPPHLGVTEPRGDSLVMLETGRLT